MPRYTIHNLLQDTDYYLLPPEGGWVMVRGNPYAARGLRVPLALRELGVQHMDVYWAYGEEWPWNNDTANEYLKQHYLSGMSKRAKTYLLHQILEHNHVDSDQATFMKLHTPHSELIRLWRVEAVLIGQEMIDDLMAEEYLTPHYFTAGNPVWDEETRDMVGSLMLDGLSLPQAQHELITARELKTSQIVKPNHFFRASGPLRATFCEEDDYE